MYINKEDTVKMPHCYIAHNLHNVAHATLYNAVLDTYTQYITSILHATLKGFFFVKLLVQSLKIYCFIDMSSILLDDALGAAFELPLHCSLYPRICDVFLPFPDLYTHLCRRSSTSQ